MGAVLEKMYFKKAFEDVECPDKSLWQIEQLDIDGDTVGMGHFLEEDTKCVLFINVATKWGLTEANYEILNQLYD